MSSTIEQWGRDLRHGARALRRAPGFTAVAVATLGLSIGVNAGMFSVVNAVLLNPLPFPNADRLVAIHGTAPGTDMPQEFDVAREFFLHYKEQSQLLEDVGFYFEFTNTMRAGDRVERILLSAPPPSLFTTLGARTILGRLPVETDDDRAAVLSHGLWQSWFGGDPGVVGRSYFIAGANRTVVGVMEHTFKFPSANTLAWISIPVRAAGLAPGQFGVPLVARMKPGATIEAVTSELNTLARQLPARFGGSANYARIIEQHRAVVRPFDEEVLGGVARPLWILFGAAAIVLLIACANVANLFMVRAEGRQRDFAVRRAIGATRAQLVRVQMSEAVVVAASAAVAAVLIAILTLPAFLQAAPAGIPRLDEAGFTRWTLLFTVVAAALTALVCGAAPAWRMSGARFSGLREGNRTSTRGRQWGRDGLVAAESALALVLLIGSGLLLRSYSALRDVDPGYDPADIFTFQIAPEGAHLNDGPSFARFSLDFMDRLRALPGVQLVGLVENIPINEGTATVRFRPEGSHAGADAGPIINVTYSAGDYFEAMDIDLVAGRAFDTNDHLSHQRYAVLSRSAAEALWPGQTAIGKRLQGEDSAAWHTVIGVVEDVKQYNLRQPPDRHIYLPLVGPEPASWMISSPAYVIKTPRAETIGPEVRALVRDVAPTAPMYRVFTMQTLVNDTLVDLSFTMLTLALASGLALFLGAVGLYGLLSSIVAQRTREIGVRLALGARVGQVRRMVVLQGVRLVAVGIVVGVVAALWGTRALRTLLFGVESTDIPTFVATSTVMILIGVVASYLPARRASRVDPAVSLQGE